MIVGNIKLTSDDVDNTKYYLDTSGELLSQNNYLKNVLVVNDKTCFIKPSSVLKMFGFMKDASLC